MKKSKNQKQREAAANKAVQEAVQETLRQIQMYQLRQAQHDEARRQFTESQQSIMQNTGQNYNYSYLQIEESRQRALWQQRLAQNPFVATSTGPTVPERYLADQVLCARCADDDEDCWDCSGTGVDPIPFAEVNSGVRGDE